ncbi:hypothetical protein F4808DRAFT_410475 [Astrocystis sublimbata]|nr:hypothetical protein F4808DRAFT_410475 [Astrocystis sublimbata]
MWFCGSFVRKQNWIYDLNSFSAATHCARLSKSNTTTCQDADPQNTVQPSQGPPTMTTLDRPAYHRVWVVPHCLAISLFSFVLAFAIRKKVRASQTSIAPASFPAHNPLSVQEPSERALLSLVAWECPFQIIGRTRYCILTCSELSALQVEARSRYVYSYLSLTARYLR